MANIAFNEETGEALRFDAGQNQWVSTQVATDEGGTKRVGWDGQSWVSLPDVKQEPTFMGDVGRSVMRGKQQLDIATTILGRELGIHSDEEAAKLISKDVAESAKYAPSKRLEKIQTEAEQDKTFGDVLKRYADRPIYDSLRYVTSIVAESLVPSVVAGGAGALAGSPAGPIGAAAGLGTGSAALEYASTILSKLQDAGVKIDDPKAVQAFLSDPEKMSEARQSGLLRGIPIGVFDAVTAGAAGRFIAPLKAAEEAGAVISRGKKAVAGAKEVGLQMAGGAGGEMAAGLAEKGQIDPKAAFDEAIAELPTGLLEMMIGVKVRNRKGASTNPADLSLSDVEESIRSIKADQEKEIAGFEKAVSSMGIPADAQNAVLSLGEKVWNPNTQEEDIAETFNKIKEQYPDLGDTLTRLVPTLTKLRTRADAVQKLEGISQTGRTGKRVDAASAMQEAMQEPADYEGKVKAETEARNAAGVVSEQDVAEAAKQREQYLKAQEDAVKAQETSRENLTAENAVPVTTGEEIPFERAAAQQAAEPKTETPPDIGRQLGLPEKTPTEQTVEAAQESQKVSEPKGTEGLKNVIDSYVESIKNEGKEPEAYLLQSYLNKDFGRGVTLSEAQDEINARSNKPVKGKIPDIAGGKIPSIKGRKSELSIDNILSEPSTNPSYNVSQPQARDVIEQYLKKMEERGQQGKLSAAALRDAIFNKSYDVNQALTALKIIKGVEKVMGKAAEKNPVAIRFIKDGKAAAMRRTIDDTAVNSVLEFSLSKDAMNAAGQNYAHEAMHVLQDLFKQVDPAAHKILSKVFKKGMTINDIPRNIVNFLKSRENPHTGQSYWSSIEKTIESATTEQDRDEMELMAYTFGAINEIMETNPKVIPPIGGVFTRFARFIGNVLRSIRDSVFGSDSAKALDIMKETASGYRGTQFKEAPLTKLVGNERASKLENLSKEDAFNKLADDQRGLPEVAMRNVQSIMNGGVVPHAVEHVGDLTHRMSQYGGMLADSNVPSKVRSVLSSLRNKYGFAREHNENVESAARFRGIDKNELNSRFDAALSEYANEHKRLEVYNAMQDHAREAAISLGEKNFNKTERHLSAIERALKSGMYSRQVQEYNPDYPRRIHPDIAKQSGRKSQLSIERDSRLAAENISKTTSADNMKDAKGFRQRIANFIRMADPLHGVPLVDAYRIYKYTTNGQIKKVSDELKKLMPAIEKASGERETIFKFMTTKDANPAVIKDTAARASAVRAKQIINRIGEELLKRNLITPQEREKYGDSYLPRLFAAYINNRKLVTGLKIGTMPYLESRKDLPEDRLIELGEIRDPSFLIHEAIFRPMRDMAVIDFYQKLNDKTGAKWVIGLDKIDYNGEKLSAADLYNRVGYLQDMIEHNQIPEDRLSKTQAVIADMKRTADKLINDIGKDIDINKYKRVPDNKSYGPLRGMWVMNQIYNDVMGAGAFYPSAPEGFIGSVSDFSKDVNTWFKKAKVTLNPPTIATNIISNMIMMSFADVRMDRIPLRIFQVMKDFSEKGELYRISQKYDMAGTSLSETELKNIYEEMKKRNADGSGMTASFNMIASAFKVLGKKTNKISDMYGALETIFKMAIVKDAITSQGLSEEQAVLKANKYLFDYSETHPTIKTLRNMPLGAPFITWTYKMIPLMLETAVLKPHKFAFIGALYAAIALAADKALEDAGADSEDKKKLANYLSKAGRENMLAAPTGLAKRYILGQNGMDDVSLSYTNIGKFLPIDPFFRIFNAVSSGEPKTILKEGFGALGGPTADGLYALFTGKDMFTNTDIVPKGADPLTKATAIANFAANEMLPPVLKDIGKLSVSYALGDAESKARSEGLVVNVIKNIAGEKTAGRPGLPEKKISDLAANFFGMTTYNPSIMQFKINLDRFDSEVKDLQTEMRKDMQDPRISPEEKAAISKDYQEKIRRKMLEKKKFVDASGISPKAYELLRKSLE